MRLQKYLQEDRKRDVISVDIQPEYKKWISFNIFEYTKFLNKQKEILYLYNGPDSIGTSDSEIEISMWLVENGLDENKLNDFYWIDKGYGNLRGWMDQGVDKSIIKQALRYMLRRGEQESRDIPEEEWIEEIPELENIYFDDLILLPPEINIGFLKKWKGSFIVGGGENECYEEIMILLSTFNIKVVPVKKFIY